MQFWAENLTAVLFLFYSSGTFDIKVSSWMLYRLEAAEKKNKTIFLDKLTLQLCWKVTNYFNFYSLKSKFLRYL